MTNITIFYGSVYGAAEALSEDIKQQLETNGAQVKIAENPQISDVEQADNVLIVSSTTGQGDIPGNLEGLFHEMRDQFPLLNGKAVGVIGLGDSSYGDTYCGAGKQWSELLEELQGNVVKDMLKIDAMETFEPKEEALPWVDAWLTAVRG